jgi:hypothetical protein
VFGADISDRWTFVGEARARHVGTADRAVTDRLLRA